MAAQRLAKQAIPIKTAPAIIHELLHWYSINGRSALPWRKTRDPYRVLVSELMLQQTQVSRVAPKYLAFVKRFPTLRSLADAPRAEVLQYWQGLGYNSRAARLHALACAKKEGLPATYDELLRLPGIGPYTAGAVMIFAHDAVAPSVDVNVARVVRRLCWKPTVLPSQQDVANHALKFLTMSGRPHDWQSTLMDFGSLVCKKIPDCANCPVRSYCKSKGARSDDSLAKKQSPFLGSVRWWRGQILRSLLKGPVPSRMLLYRIKELPDVDDEELFAKALAALKKEGVVHQDRLLLMVK